MIDSPPSPCPHQLKPTEKTSLLLSASTCQQNCQPKDLPPLPSLQSTSPESSTSATSTSAAPSDPSFLQQQQQQLLIRRKFVDIVKRLCNQLATKMTTKTGTNQNKIKDLKQVAPLQVPKEETDVTEPVQLGDVILLRKSSPNGKVRDHIMLSFKGLVSSLHLLFRRLLHLPDINLIIRASPR